MTRRLTAQRYVKRLRESLLAMGLELPRTLWRWSRSAGCPGAFPTGRTVALIVSAVSLAGEVGVDAERGLRFVTIDRAADAAYIRVRVIMSDAPSSRLAPSAKKLQLRSSENDRVAALVQIAPSVDAEVFRHEVEARGGIVRSWLGPANVVSVEFAARRLSELADLPGVIYVEAAQAYRP